MALQFFNTYSRRKEEFTPLSPGDVKMYTCGPTVYDYAHIGNFRAYAFEDILRRYLRYKGYRVTQVMNITDVDDKIIERSIKNNEPAGALSGRYTRAFFEDLDTLNIQRAEQYPKATDHVKEMANLILTLLAKGMAYKSEDGSIYFPIRKFPAYGGLAHFKVEDLIAGARVKQDSYEKEAASDFALWKAWDEKDGDVFWPRPGEVAGWPAAIPKGRPGWHIECSAMSMKYLGSSFDIHTGGVDNIFPHHENEIAQSEAATGSPFVRYWLHCEHLLVDNKKMSKSLGNFHTVRSLIAGGYDPMAVRYVYIASQYRSKLNFTLEGLKAAQETWLGLRGFLTRLGELPSGDAGQALVDTLVDDARRKFEAAMDDDLNTPAALAALFDLRYELNRQWDLLGAGAASRAVGFYLDVDRVFGLNLESREELTPDEQALVAEREEARAAKNWVRSDEIRAQFQAQGVFLEDVKGGSPRVVIKRNAAAAVRS